MLPDIEGARTSAADMEAHADALEAMATEEEKAAVAARQAALSSKERFNKLDLVRQEHEMLVLEGKAARAELDAANKEVDAFAAELADLAGADAEVKELEPKAASLGALERRAQLLAALLNSANELARLIDEPQPPAADEAGLAAVEEGAMSARVGPWFGRGKAPIGCRRARRSQTGPCQVRIAFRSRRLPPVRPGSWRRIRPGAGSP